MSPASCSARYASTTARVAVGSGGTGRSLRPRRRASRPEVSPGGVARQQCGEHADHDQLHDRSGDGVRGEQQPPDRLQGTQRPGSSRTTYLREPTARVPHLSRRAGSRGRGRPTRPRTRRSPAGTGPARARRSGRCRSPARRGSSRGPTTTLTSSTATISRTAAGAVGPRSTGAGCAHVPASASVLGPGQVDQRAATGPCPAAVQSGGSSAATTADAVSGW